jgi:hypothetical protein
MPMAEIRAALKARRDPAALALKARLAEVAHRYAKRRRARPVPFAALRMRDLEIIFVDRYGGRLPDDDAGLGDARVAVYHLANLPGNQGENIFSWLARWTPWMPPDQMADLVDEAIEHPRRWKADTFAALTRYQQERIQEGHHTLSRQNVNQLWKRSAPRAAECCPTAGKRPGRTPSAKRAGP